MSHLDAIDLTVSISNRTILDRISVGFERGKVTAIVGPNGAGKSTFLDCLACLRRPQSGAITLDGGDIRALPARVRARQLGYLPQSAEVAWEVDCETFVGLGRTPYKGAWGLSHEDRAHIAKAMADTGTQGFAKRVVTSLSGGERARVMIARVLAGQPQWLLADEPLAGLDPGHVLDVCELFQTLAKTEGYGVIVTLHDLDAAMRVADRVIVLSKGQIIADGQAREALSPDILRQAYGVESHLVEGTHGSVLEIIRRAK